MAAIAVGLRLLEDQTTALLFEVVATGTFWMYIREMWALGEDHGEGEGDRLKFTRRISRLSVSDNDDFMLQR